MIRLRLAASVAVAPLLMFAGVAHATTEISDTRTTGVQTSTIGAGNTPDDIKIGANGKFKLTAAGAAVTLNSNNNVTNTGDISTKAVDNSIGIKAVGGNTGNILNQGTIVLDDDYTPTDVDKDGDLDGVTVGDTATAFAQGTGRIGIQVVGPGAFTGDITNDLGASITVTGNNSYGISLETPLNGSLINKGQIVMTGNNDAAIRITSGSTVSGDLKILGSIAVVGGGSTGVDVNADVNGAVVLQGAIGVTGYRYTTRPVLAADRAKLDADDLQQGGPAVRISGNVGSGVVLDAPPRNLITDDSAITPVAGTVTANDEDGDGVADSAESTASVSVFGSAPALLIGSSTQSIVIGNAPEGINPAQQNLYSYGLVIRGAIGSNGVYDGATSTAVQIGDSAAPLDGSVTTNLSSGIRISGGVAAASYSADSTGLLLNAGAIAPEIKVEGVVVASTTETSGPGLSAGFTATGILIKENAQVSTINNSGTISATASGENSGAYALVDKSGNVTTINNTKVIQAVAARTDDADDTDDADNDAGNEAVGPKFVAVAVDVSKNTTGVTLTQTGVNDGDDGADGVADADADADGVDDADEPSIFGDVRFGSGNDKFLIQNGTVDGNISFGDGNDQLSISGGGDVLGGLTHGSGTFDVSITKGILTLTNVGSNGSSDGTPDGIINATSVNLGADAQLVITADPSIAGQKNSEFVTTTATLASGAKLGLQLNTLVTSFVDADHDGVVDNAVFTAIHTTTPGGLTVGAGVDGGLVSGNTPFLYKSQVKVDAAAGDVNIVLTRRTTDELGLNAEGAAAFDSFYTALSGDTGVTGAILAQTTQKDFLKLYNQLLPNPGEGIFSALDMTSRAVGRIIADRPDRTERYGPDSLWIQEVNADVMRDAGVGLGSDTKAFGFVAGYESMGDDGGALGATLAYVTAEEHDKDAQVGEQVSISSVEASVYWRRSVGNWLFAARGAGGYVWFDGDRRFVYPNSSTSTSVLREYDSGWTGYTLAANASVSYEARFGRYYVRPQLNLDYFHLNEEGYSESGGSNNQLGLIISSRTSDRLSASAEVAFGATFGRDLWWRPEVRIGYRQVASGGVGDLTAQFQGGGSPFLLQAENPDGGAAILALALKAGTAMSYVAVQGEIEALDSETRYNLRLEGRMMF